MIRVRFVVDNEDPRPVIFPIKHPYWVTGYEGESGAAILVAYADDQDEILQNWTDAEKIDVLNEDVESYSFSDRFPKPEWFNQVT